MRYGAVNVTTFVMLGFALWVIFTRIRARPDNNWPVVFYPVITTFAIQIPGRVDINWLLTGIASALLLRFEFVGGFISHVVRLVDFVALLAISYFLFQSTVY
jgi:hypothetical protein